MNTLVEIVIDGGSRVENKLIKLYSLSMLMYGVETEGRIRCHLNMNDNLIEARSPRPLSSLVG